MSNCYASKKRFTISDNTLSIGWQKLRTLRGWGLLAVTTGLSTGCMTVASGNSATPVSASGQTTRVAPELRVTSEVSSRLSTKHLLAIEITFENASSKWRYVDEISIALTPGASKQIVKVPVGEPLRSWHRATEQRLDVSRANRQMVLGAIAIGGALVSIGGAAANRPQIAAAGKLATAAAGAAHLVQKESVSLELVGAVQTVPETHLLSVPFSIAPGLFTKKWVLLYTPEQANSAAVPLLVQYTLRSGKTERARLNHPTEQSRRSRMSKKKYGSRKKRAVPKDAMPR